MRWNWGHIGASVALAAAIAAGSARISGGQGAGSEARHGAGSILGPRAAGAQTGGSEFGRVEGLAPAPRVVAAPPGEPPGYAITIVTEPPAEGWWSVRCDGRPAFRAWISGGHLLGATWMPGCMGPESPTSAVLELLAAYALRSPDLCAASLAEDYLFTSDDPEFVAAWPRGMTREDERRFVEHLASGGVTAEGRVLPAIDRVAIAVEDLDVSLEDGGRSARILARGVHTRMGGGDELVLESEDDQTFELVRIESEGLRARAGLAVGPWRIRRWHEAARPAEGASAAAVTASSEPRAEARLAMRRLSGPREWPVQLEIQMPGAGDARFEVFDVAGRVVVDRRLHAAQGGPLRFALDAVGPGVYFARVRSEGQSVTSKLIVLR